MKFSEPLISIITSTYNASETIERCLRSIQQQTYEDYEHIIVDGGSTDGTIDIISKYANLKNSKISWWTSEPDNGIYDAWNKALSHARGKWIHFLGADDYYYSDGALEKVAEYLTGITSEYGIIYGKVARFDGNTLHILDWLGKECDEGMRLISIIATMSYQTTLPHQGIFHRRQLFQTYGYFDTNFKINGDLDFTLRFLKEVDAKFIDLPIVMMQSGGISNMRNTEFIRKNEQYYALKKNGLASLNHLIIHMMDKYMEIMYLLLPQSFHFLRNKIRMVYGKEPIT